MEAATLAQRRQISERRAEGVHDDDELMMLSITRDGGDINRLYAHYGCTLITLMPQTSLQTKQTMLAHVHLSLSQGKQINLNHV